LSEFHQNLEHGKGEEILNRVNLKTLFGSINDFIFILNSEAKILEINPVVLKRLKYSREELIGNSVLMVHPPDQRETAKAIIKDMVEGKGTICPIPLLTKDGDLIPVETKVTKGTLGNIEVLIGISRDISERKRTENQLKRERDIFRSITEISPLGIVMVNEDGEITFANHQAEKLLGLEKYESTQRTYNAPSWKITDFEGNPFPDQQLPFQQVKYLKQHVFDIRHAIEWPNGNRIFLSINAAPILDEDGNFKGMVATFNNITEKKKIEERLRKEQSRAELYLDLAGVIIVALNKKGEITLMNKKGYEVLGYEDGELIGKHWFSTCIPSRLKDRVFDVFTQLMRGEIEPVEFFENPVITNNGKEKIIAWHNALLYDESKKIVGTLSSGEDITERKQSEKKLQDQQAALESIFKAAPTGIGVVVNRVITQVNDRFTDLVGYSRNELLGKSARIVYPTDEDYEFVGREKYAQIQKNGIGTVETRFKRKDGKIIDVLLSSAPINPIDPSAGVSFTALDITKRKEVEEELKKSEEKYRNAYNRSNLYKDVFTHDINNILQNILSSLELTKLFSYNSKRIQAFEEVTNLIYEQVVRGKFLVTNVQELYKTDEIESPIISFEAFNILKDVIKSINNRFPKKVIDIKIEAFQNKYFVRANELLKDVFENILSNAVQHNTNPVKEIFIKISKEKKDETQLIKFEFLDNGIGIPDSMKQNIFSREYKSEETPSGIGLGLLLVKRILETYNGEIRVDDSIRGDFTKGCNFIISIPEAV